MRKTFERRCLDSSARARLAMPVRDYEVGEFEAAEGRVDAVAFAGELERALGDLPPDLRRALELRVVGDLSYEELAREEGISETNARMRVSRALRSMAVRLTDSGGKA